MMFKRLFWMIIGASVGLWARSRVLQAIEKYIPAPMARMIKRTTRNIMRDIKDRTQRPPQSFT